MENVIELHHWAAFQFGRFEYRLCGYLLNEQGATVKCVITEPLSTIDPVSRLAVAADGKTYRPMDRIVPGDKIDMMYVIGRFCDVNIKRQPGDVSEMIEEELTKGKEV